MSAAEDDTELRDLSIQNSENSGVLNKSKAEMRAAVFSAMEDQDRSEKKTPLINENLKNFLNTKDGRSVASLIVDFSQVFNSDFSSAVFQPEINASNGSDGRDSVCGESGVSESESNRNAPVLSESVRGGRRKDGPSDRSEGDRSVHVLKEVSQKQIRNARKTFDLHVKDQSGSVSKEDSTSVFTDSSPGSSKNMLERFVDDEVRAADSMIDFQSFLAMYKRLFNQCRSVVVSDSDEIRHQTPEDKPASPPVSKIPRFKGQRSQAAAKESERLLSSPKIDLQQQDQSSAAARRDHSDSESDEGVDHDEEDSFFDDPSPKPQKIYGCSPIGEKDLSERTNSPKEKLETSGTRGSPVGSASEAPRPAGGSSGSEPSSSRNGAKNSKEKNFKAPSDRTRSLHLDEDVEYDDDFNSHRSDLSNGESSIGEEIEEVSIEGPENSDKFDETTQDSSVSQLSQSHGADYMEDVS